MRFCGSHNFFRASDEQAQTDVFTFDQTSAQLNLNLTIGSSLRDTPTHSHDRSQLCSSDDGDSKSSGNRSSRDGWCCSVASIDHTDPAVHASRASQQVI